MNKPKLPANITPIEWVNPEHPFFDDSGLIHYAHIPPAATLANLAPIVVMVHGRSGDESVMWLFKQAIPNHVAIVAPRAPIKAAEDGFVWFDNENGTLTPSSASLEQGLTKLEHFIKSLPYLYPIDPNRMVFIGFSQGAALVSSYVMRHPEGVIGVASLAGAMVQSTNGQLPAEPLTNLPVFIAHGINDDTIPLYLAQQTRDKFLGWGAQVTYNEYATGHKMNTQGIKNLKSWLSARFQGKLDVRSG